jgi:hypothetical protein
MNQTDLTRLLAKIIYQRPVVQPGDVFATDEFTPADLAGLDAETAAAWLNGTNAQKSAMHEADWLARSIIAASSVE